MRHPCPTLILLVLTAPAPGVALAQGGRAAPGPTDSITIAAARAIESGRPWQATRMLAAPSRESGAKPSVILTAARAAAGWQGWATVVRLLDGQRWLDDYGGEGQALLARALVERSQPEEALAHTRRSLELGPPPTRAERLVTHARALDRLDQFDSAAAAYRTLAQHFPALKDWFYLRAAGVTVDSIARGRLLNDVTSPVARPRIGWTEALARDRTGDEIGAAERYDALGARLAAVRLRLKTGDPSARTAARAELLALLGPDQSADDAKAAIAMLDRDFPDRTPAEELRIARRAAATGLLEQAARGFAATTGKLVDRDRFTYATVLARLGRVAQALPLFDAVETPDLKADAAYQKARMKLRNGNTDGAEAALAAIAADYPTDSTPVAQALYLAADLKADRGDDDDARALFRKAARYSAAPFAPRSAFQAALIALLAHDPATAATEFDRLADRGGEESIAARYWSARAHAVSGDTAAARTRWRTIVERAPDSYYAWLSSRRLGVPFRIIADRPDSAAPELPADGLERAALLSRLGLDVEARFELDHFVAVAGSAPERMLRTAVALARYDYYARALRLAQRAQEKGAPLDRTLAQLLYPLPFADVLRGQAASASLDPMLAAAVIRQESAFDPEARSAADARGLMQLLPAVGAELARRAGLPEWDAVLLYQPDVNLDFGIDHLAHDLARLDWPERGLAAYNAGIERVNRWRSIRGVDDDPEVFVERIPFAETRDYVRRVLRNQAVYRSLYTRPSP